MSDSKKFFIVDYLDQIYEDSTKTKVTATLNKFCRKHDIQSEKLINVCNDDYNYTYANNEALPSELIKPYITRGRNNYIVDGVIIVSDNPHAWWNEATIEKWAFRHEEIYICDYSYLSPHIERYEIYEHTHDLVLDKTLDDLYKEHKRLIVSIWFEAFGIQLSAPPILKIRDNDITERAERQKDIQRMYRMSSDRHYTKPSTNRTNFLIDERTIASDKEIDEAYQYIMYMLDLIAKGVISEHEALEPNYIICKECGYPTRVSFDNFNRGVCVCDVCGKETSINGVEENASNTPLYNLITKGYIF